MKKDILFSLIVLLIVFAGIPGNTAYQSHSFHYKTYRVSNNIQKKSAGILGHRFLNKLIDDDYKKGCDLIASRVDRGGIITEMLGFEITKFWGRNLANYHTISVSQKTEG